MKRGTLLDLHGLGAFSAYFALALLFFGRGLPGHFTSSWIGQAQGDPSVYTWALAWLPHALGRWQNPTFTDALWAPQGVNLLWKCWMPLAGLLEWPVTRSLGPVASFNLLTLPMIPLAAWSAYLLCDYIVASRWCALVGGYLFGFCGYMSFYLWVGSADLIAIFGIPLGVLAVLRAINGDLSPRCLIAGLTTLLVAQFLLFIEIFATATMFGFMVYALALFIYPEPTRARLRAMIGPIIKSFALAILILSPYLYLIFSAPTPDKPLWQTFLSSADLLFFLLPSHVSELARNHAVSHLLDRFPTTIYVGYTYLGPILLAVAAAYARERWAEPSCRVLLVAMALIAVASLGPELIVGGRRITLMPGAILTALPLIKEAVPVRFVLYLALAASIVTALWLSKGRAGLPVKCGAAALAVLFTLPSLSGSLWNSRDNTPAFFLDGTYRHYINPGEIAVVVPYGWLDNSMIWQAHTDMYFRMAGGFTVIPSRAFQQWPAMIALYNGNYLPEPELQLKAFLAAHQVTVVLVDERAARNADRKRRQDYDTVLAALGPPLEKAGGVLIYRFRPGQLASWSNWNPIDLERRADEARFAVLLEAAHRYLQSGGGTSQLDASTLERANLLRADWVGGPDIRISNGFWLKGHDDGTIEAGIFGSHVALLPIIQRYRAAALNVRIASIPSVEDHEKDAAAHALELMQMTFDRKGLARALDILPPSPASASLPLRRAALHPIAR